MKIKSDSKFDHELASQRILFDTLLLDTQRFMATHSTLPPRDKILALQKIKKGFSSINQFINRSHSLETTTARQRFSLENLKNSFSSLQGRWVKFEKSIS